MFVVIACGLKFSDFRMRMTFLVANVKTNSLQTEHSQLTTNQDKVWIHPWIMLKLSGCGPWRQWLLWVALSHRCLCISCAPSQSTWPSMAWPTTLFYLPVLGSLHTQCCVSFQVVWHQTWLTCTHNCSHPRLSQNQLHAISCWELHSWCHASCEAPLQSHKNFWIQLHVTNHWCLRRKYKSFGSKCHWKA